MATKNVKKPAILKSFRLLDFNIYDETTEKENSDSEGSDNDRKKQYSSKFVIQMFGVLRVDIGRGLNNGRWTFAFDVTRDLWPIL